MNDYYEFEWQQLRSEVYEYHAERNRKLIEKWCEECNVTSPVGYENNLDGVMTIYTKHPGKLIGKGGKDVEKFKAELKQEFGIYYEVKFVEIRGEIVNIKNKEE